MKKYLIMKKKMDLANHTKTFQIQSIQTNKNLMILKWISKISKSHYKLIMSIDKSLKIMILMHL